MKGLAAACGAIPALLSKCEGPGADIAWLADQLKVDRKLIVAAVRALRREGLVATFVDVVQLTDKGRGIIEAGERRLAAEGRA